MASVVGIPREIKEHEGRVAIAPAGVHVLCQGGQQVLIESGAGLGSGIANEEFSQAGAEIVEREEVFSRSDIIVKVKEPLQEEYDLLRAGQIVFTFFHFAASRPLLEAMLQREITCVAYETIRDRSGHLPILTPMSEVAGRMAVFEGSRHLESPSGGRGVLVSGVPGVEPAKLVILGGGVVGLNAAKIAAGTGAQVTIFDVSHERLRYLDDILPANVTTLYSNPLLVSKKVRQADLVIGAVLVAGAKAPVLVSREDVKMMKDASVLIDVAVDQGGCIETCRPTTHSDPTYVEEGVLHYCVANMPGAVARTSTFALTNVTLPYLEVLAREGIEGFLGFGEHVAAGLNAHAGGVYHEGVAGSFDLPLESVASLLGKNK